MIDLMRLKRILQLHAPESDPKIFSIKYSRQETKLSINYLTPIAKKPKKNTKVNIFRRGKINILGAFEAAATSRICEQLHMLFETHYSSLVVFERCSKPTRASVPLVKN